MPTPGCPCDKLIACLDGRCVALTFHGIFSAPEEDPLYCPCCADFNTTYKFRIGFNANTCDNECVMGGGEFLPDPADSCHCFDSSGAGPNSVVGMVGCGFSKQACTTILEDSAGFNAYIGWVPGFTSSDFITFGTDNRFDPGEIELAKANIEKLCAGEEVTLPWCENVFTDPSTMLRCFGGPDAYVTIQVTDDEDCAGEETPGDIDPDDEDGIPGDDCDTLDECTEFWPMDLKIQDLEDCEIPDNAGDHPYLEERFYSNLNKFGSSIGYPCIPALDVTIPSFHCFVPTKYDFLTWLGDYSQAVYESRDDATKAANPGVLLRRETHTESFQDLLYCIAIEVRTYCDPSEIIDTGKRWFIASIHLKEQFVRNLWDGVGYNTPSLYSELCEDITSTVSLTGAVAKNCKTQHTMFTSFNYDLCGAGDVFQASLTSIGTPPI